MIERSEHLSATSEAYDAIADLYAEIAADYLDPLPLDRAVLAAFAEYVRGARDRFGSNAGTASTTNQSRGSTQRPDRTRPPISPTIQERVPAP